MKQGHKPKDISVALDISEAMISKWRRNDNDFVPRLEVAIRIYEEFKYITYPYAVEALDGSYGT